VTATPGLISTDYGRIWGFYYPLANAQETRTSVLAVEFASGAVSTGNLKILAGTILIILISSGAAISLAVWRFHTISNLSHRASYNIDTMTGFKSRNTFDLDMTNINSTRTYESLTIYYIDLNDLKKVNDTQGHNAGDEYLKIMADLTRDSFDAKDIIYRVGGDEFCVISFNHVRNLAREKTKYFLKNVGDYSVNSSKNYSAAIGFAIFDYSMDVDASSTRIRAEMIMYENKRRMKSGKELLLDDNPLIARQIANQWEHAARCDEHSIDT
jgi:diguanylate cyclase (GGDEF)-like protein